MLLIAALVIVLLAVTGWVANRLASIMYPDEGAHRQLGVVQRQVDAEFARIISRFGDS